MKKIILCALFCAVATISAFAQAAKPYKMSDYRACYELFDVSGVKEEYNSSLIEEALGEIGDDPENAPLRRAMIKWINKYMSYDILKKDMAEIFLSEFSVSEIKQLVGEVKKEKLDPEAEDAFLETRLGKKFERFEPKFEAAMEKWGEERAEKYQQELLKMVLEEMQQ